MATAYIAYLTDMKAEVFLSPYENLQWTATSYQGNYISIYKFKNNCDKWHLQHPVK